MNILTVDDDAVIRMTLAEILKTEPDWQIVDADDGEVAWQMLDNGLDVDLCIFDNVMPRLMGIELIRRMRNDDRFKKMPIVLVTLNRDRKLVLEAIELRVAGFIIKPFEATRVIKQVKAVTEKIPRRDREKNVVLDDPEYVIDRLQIDYKRYLTMLDIFIRDVQSGITDVRRMIDESDVLAAISRVDAMKGSCVTLGAHRFKKAANSISQMTPDSINRLDNALTELIRSREKIAADIEKKGLTTELPEYANSEEAISAFNEREEVLLVEDKPAIVRQFKDKLTSNSWRFTFMENSKQVQSAVLQSVPSLIVVSLSLPNDGAFELIRFLRSNAKTRKIPVWGLAVKTAALEQRKAEESGFTAVITKPIDFKDVRKRLIKVLDVEEQMEYFRTDGDLHIIKLPAEVNEELFEEIGNELAGGMSKIVENGCSKVIVDGSALPEPSVQLFKFLVGVKETCENSAMPVDLVLGSEIEKAAQETGDFSEQKFFSSLADAKAG